MAKLYDICAKSREYTDGNGNKRPIWVKIGEVHEGQYGQYAKLYRHINLSGFPAQEGSDTIIASMFEPKDKHTASDPVGMTQPKQEWQDATNSNGQVVPF